MALELSDRVLEYIPLLRKMRSDRASRGVVVSRAASIDLSSTEHPVCGNHAVGSEASNKVNVNLKAWEAVREVH